MNVRRRCTSHQIGSQVIIMISVHSDECELIRPVRGRSEDSSRRVVTTSSIVQDDREFDDLARLCFQIAVKSHSKPHFYNIGKRSYNLFSNFSNISFSADGLSPLQSHHFTIQGGFSENKVVCTGMLHWRLKFTNYSLIIITNMPGYKIPATVCLIR